MSDETSEGSWSPDNREITPNANTTENPMNSTSEEMDDADFLLNLEVFGNLDDDELNLLLSRLSPLPEENNNSGTTTTESHKPENASVPHAVGTTNVAANNSGHVGSQNIRDDAIPKPKDNPTNVEKTAQQGIPARAKDQYLKTGVAWNNSLAGTIGPPTTTPTTARRPKAGPKTTGEEETDIDTSKFCAIQGCSLDVEGSIRTKNEEDPWHYVSRAVNRATPKLILQDIDGVLKDLSLVARYDESLESTLSFTLLEAGLVVQLWYTDQERSAIVVEVHKDIRSTLAYRKEIVRSILNAVMEDPAEASRKGGPKRNKEAAGIRSEGGGREGKNAKMLPPEEKAVFAFGPFAMREQDVRCGRGGNRPANKEFKQRVESFWEEYEKGNKEPGGEKDRAKQVVVDKIIAWLKKKDIRVLVEVPFLLSAAGLDKKIRDVLVAAKHKNQEAESDKKDAAAEKKKRKKN